MFNLILCQAVLLIKLRGERGERERGERENFKQVRTRFPNIENRLGTVKTLIHAVRFIKQINLSESLKSRRG